MSKVQFWIIILWVGAWGFMYASSEVAKREALEIVTLQQEANTLRLKLIRSSLDSLHRSNAIMLPNFMETE